MRLYFKNKKEYVDTDNILFRSKAKVYIVWHIFVQIILWVSLLIIGLLLGF